MSDLLPLKDNIVTITSKAGKTSTVVLSEKDELWTKFKAMHVADVLNGLKEYLDEIKAKNPQAAKLSSGKKDGADSAPSLTDMSNMIKAMPEYQAQLDKYSQHHSIAQQCIAFIQARDNKLLNMINDIEQTLATGFDLESKPFKMSAVLEEMMDYMMSDDVSLKLRLGIILVASQVIFAFFFTQHYSLFQIKCL